MLDFLILDSTFTEFFTTPTFEGIAVYLYPLLFLASVLGGLV